MNFMQYSSLFRDQNLYLGRRVRCCRIMSSTQIVFAFARRQGGIRAKVLLLRGQPAILCQADSWTTTGLSHPPTLRRGGASAGAVYSPPYYVRHGQLNHDWIVPPWVGAGLPPGPCTAAARKQKRPNCADKWSYPMIAIFKIPLIFHFSTTFEVKSKNKVGMGKGSCNIQSLILFGRIPFLPASQPVARSVSDMHLR